MYSYYHRMKIKCQTPVAVKKPAHMGPMWRRNTKETACSWRRSRLNEKSQSYLIKNIDFSSVREKFDTCS